MPTSVVTGEPISDCRFQIADFESRLSGPRRSNRQSEIINLKLKLYRPGNAIILTGSFPIELRYL